VTPQSFRVEEKAKIFYVVYDMRAVREELEKKGRPMISGSSQGLLQKPRWVKK